MEGKMDQSEQHIVLVAWKKFYKPQVGQEKY